MSEWTREFSLPDGTPDDAVFETIVSAHGTAVVLQLLERYGGRIADSSEGLVELLRAWAQSPRGERTAWHLSFGRAHLALKEGKLDPVEAAVRVGLRIAGEGQPGTWRAKTAPMTVQVDERFAVNATAVSVGNTENGWCSIALQLADGNRTTAAEILGLSRQSLYAKLDRYNLENKEPDREET